MNFFQIQWKIGSYFSYSFDENMFYTVILNQKFELWIRFQFRVPGRALIKEQYRKNIVVFLKIAELYQKKI